ncbi:hypothetical protein [Ligilactobacillus salivarius]|uniref:hypothetical protein n=1 Tax=Ligilactobacillus salivarius TaxID=1624 RepID=UPI0021512C2D|nr:hypothetical protein [Ligilactobacillus salivarius]UUY23244.1 hypothetical protein NUU06_08370 [Ligilactobacillus salivarius]
MDNNIKLLLGITGPNCKVLMLHNGTKVVKRIAYSYNNFKHFRLRILLSLKNNVIFFPHLKQKNY